MTNKTGEVQRQYYAETAATYDGMHFETDAEHDFALAFMAGVIDHLNISSVLDVGSGTGRVIHYLSQVKPSINVLGIEPVAELRAVGHGKGIDVNKLIDGDATSLAFEDSSFDLVSAFAVLHHIRNPDIAVNEMLRVARKAIFISDTNRFGQGSWIARKLKQGLGSLGLWRIADLVKTRGKGYTYSAGDGVAYSYSIFDNYGYIKKFCYPVHIVNTVDAGPNIYASASHLALLGIKK